MTMPGPARHYNDCDEIFRPAFRGFKDTAYPLFESDTLFLECCLYWL